AALSSPTQAWDEGRNLTADFPTICDKAGVRLSRSRGWRGDGEAGSGAGEPALRRRLGSRLGHHAELLEERGRVEVTADPSDLAVADVVEVAQLQRDRAARRRDVAGRPDRKSTRLNSSHVAISY